MIPDALDRCALYNRCYDTCKSIQYHVTHDNIHRLPKFLSREDSQVEETDRGLRQGDCEFVQDLSCPECLRMNVRRLRQVEGLLPLDVNLPARPCERPPVEGWSPPCQPRGRRLCTIQSHMHDTTVGQSILTKRTH